MKPARLIPVALFIAVFFAYGCAGREAGVRVVTEKVKSSAPSGMDYISGKTEALDSVTILPKVGGKVVQVGVDVGSRVTAGQVLLRIDTADIEATRDQYRAALSEAEAGIEKAGIDLNTARQNYERALSLYKEGALSEADFDNKYAVPYELAKLQAEQTAPNRLAQARAALQSVEVSLSNSVITSPINGEVTARYINPGEICSAGKPVFLVADLGRMAVKAYVDEEKVNSLKPGQKVAVKVDPVDRVLDAEVRNISYNVDPAVKGYQVKFEISGADPSLKPGMFARVYTGGAAARQFVIPKTALINDNGNYTVFIYRDGKVVNTPVKVERPGEKFVVVGEGLSEGQDLVVYSSARLEDGMSVTVR